MTKLSIIIPMYNVAQYLDTCIASVYNQGLDENDFQVIFIDDESPDNSLQVAQKLTSEKGNASIISQKNKGLGGARNTGIDNASGDYILFLDSDDWYLPNVLKPIITLAEKNNLDILEFGAQGIDTTNNIVYTFANSTSGTINKGIDYYQKYRYMDSACNKLYNRSFLNENKLRFEEKLYIEDYEFNTRVFLHAQKVMAVNTIVAHFLQTPDSITRNVNPEKKQKMIQDIIKVMKKITFLKFENSHLEASYFDQKLSFLTTTLFYQLFKNKAKYSEYLDLKKQLQKENLFFVKNTIFDKQKNFFRILFLKNFFLIRLLAKL